MLNRSAVGIFTYYNLKISNGKAEYEEISLSLPQWEDDSISDYGYGLRELAASDDGLLYGMLEKEMGILLPELKFIVLIPGTEVPNGADRQFPDRCAWMKMFSF